MNINYLVGIDLGTSGVKVSLFAEDMSEFYADTKQYQINSPYDGYAEQNPEDWWDSVCAALKSLNQRKPEAYRSIKQSAYLVRCMVWCCWIRIDSCWDQRSSIVTPAQKHIKIS